MLDWMAAFSSACTVITMSYIAYKLRNHIFIQSYPWIAIPVLTGGSSIILTEMSFQAQGYAMDYSTLLIIMVALRYGFGMALLSGMIPLVYVSYATGFDVLQLYYFMLPAAAGVLFYRSERVTGYLTIRYKEGIISSLLYFTLIYGFHIAADEALVNIHALSAFAVHLLLSLAAITVIIAMFNDENQNWLKQRELEFKANHDELTKLPNIRNFLEIAAKANRVKPVSIMMIDIDNFKLYNDQFGHLQGDCLLQEIASILQHNIGEKDYLARYGGEEFIVLCESTSQTQLYQLADRLCRKVAAHHFPGQSAMPRQLVSVSIGIAKADNASEELLPLISKADEALYLSKNNGKNQFVLYPPSTRLKRIHQPEL